MRTVILLALMWASGCTVYAYEGPPPEYASPAYYPPAPMVARAPVRYWGWSRTYTIVPHRHNTPCRGRR